MKKIVSSFLLLSIVLPALAQKIHTPAEIINIMEKSKVSYEIEMLDLKLECADYTEKLNYHDKYRIETDSGLFTYSYSPNSLAKPYFDKAEQYYNEGKNDFAFTNYQLALKADSGLYLVMTYIGQLYEHNNDYENAIEWYKKAISKNYIDYMAHWFLADALVKRNDLQGAVDHIVIAHILNRNNPRIKDALFRILHAADYTTDDWCFNPQIELSKISDNKVSVKFDSKWTGYAVAKAVWAFEPGYSRSMGVEPGHYSTIEDKECLISLLMGLESSKAKIKKDAQLVVLKKAAEDGYINEYIMYEIMLPPNPDVVNQLSKETIMRISDYLLKYRFAK